MTDQQKIHPHTPVQLKTLAVCTRDYFMGFPGPTLAVEVDARTRADDLLVSLINDEEWPASLPESAIEALAKDAIGGEALKHNTRLFPDVHPEEYPNQYGMDGAPYIKPTRMPDSDEWFTVDEDGDLSGPYGTYGEAMCAAWDEAANGHMVIHAPEPTYAYFGLYIPIPDGCDVRMVHGDTTWEFVLLDEDGSPLSNGESSDSFDTEFDARLAAWQDKLRSTLGEPTTDEVLVMDRHAYLESVCESALRGLSFASTEEQLDRELDKLSLAVSRLSAMGTERRGFDDIEIATVLDALRHYQQCTDEADRQDSEITGPVGYLSNDAIDALCERINFGDF